MWADCCTAAHTYCELLSRTTNNRKCSRNNADMRRCSRMRSRAFAYHHTQYICTHTHTHIHAHAHMDETQLSSAITQNANRARKCAILFSSTVSSPATSIISLWKSKRPVERTAARTNFTKWRMHRKDYLPRARFGCRGGWHRSSTYTASEYCSSYKSKSWTELSIRKMRIARVWRDTLVWVGGRVL